MAVFATIYARSAISGSLCVARLHFCISSPLPFSPTHTLHPSTVVSILPSSIPSPFPFLHPHSLVHSSFLPDSSPHPWTPNGTQPAASQP
jgi:hypothetical protein